MKTKMFMVTIIALFTMSCKGSDAMEISTTFDIPVKEVVFPHGSGEKTITVNCNKGFTVSSSSQWCKVSKVKSGVMVTVTTNETAEERTATITVICCDNLTDVIMVKQLAFKPRNSLHSELISLRDDPSKIWFSAHRGNTYQSYTQEIPENSLEAFQMAIANGVDIIETDIKTTKDGKLIVMHDATVDRTTNGTGSVKNLTLEQIKKLRLKVGEKVTYYTVPTLEEALLAGRGKIYFMLDDMTWTAINNVKQIVTLVESLNMIDAVLFYVGDKKDIANQIITHNPQSLIIPWVADVSDIDYWPSTFPNNCITVHHSIANSYDELISSAKEKQMISLGYLLWSAGDDQILKGDYSRADRIKSKQIQIVHTDYTELYKEYINR